jgi:hypothetical protein
VRQPLPRRQDFYREFVRRLAPPLPLPLRRHLLLQESRDSQSPDPRGRDYLMDLIEIGRRVLQGSNPWAAAGEIAEQDNSSNSHLRHAKHKKLYKDYRKEAAIYLRIAQAPDVNTCILEILREALIILHDAESVASMLRHSTSIHQTD